VAIAVGSHAWFASSRAAPQRVIGAVFVGPPGASHIEGDHRPASRPRFLNIWRGSPAAVAIYYRLIKHTKHTQNLNGARAIPRLAYVTDGPDVQNSVTATQYVQL